VKDGNVTATQRVNASIPSLRGDAVAALTTSQGTVAQAAPGSSASVALVDPNPEPTYARVAYAELASPPAAP
jgi:hypothetical protein